MYNNRSSPTLTPTSAPAWSLVVAWSHGRWWCSGRSRLPLRRLDLDPGERDLAVLQGWRNDVVGEDLLDYLQSENS